MSGLSHTSWYCFGSALALLAAVFGWPPVACAPNRTGLFRAEPFVADDDDDEPVEPEETAASRSLLPAAGMITTKLWELTFISGGKFMFCSLAVFEWQPK